MHIHTSVYGHFLFLYIFIAIVIYNWSSILFIISVCITLIISMFALHLYWKLLTPRPIPCVCKHTRSESVTYDVHQSQDVVLHMLFAMEAHDRVVHGEQHLDVVVVFLGVSAFALRLWQLLLQRVESVGQLGDTEACDWKHQRFTAMQTMAFCFSIIKKKLMYAVSSPKYESWVQKT